MSGSAEDESGGAVGERELPAVRDYDGVQVFVSALTALVVTSLVLWWANGYGAFYESLFRVAPTVEGGGVGADWLAGNTIPALDFLIALIHAMDVILGLFVLFLVFVHWSAFRRLAGQMRRPGEVDEEAVLADGGAAEPTGGEGR